jgi:hypothetical protein
LWFSMEMISLRAHATVSILTILSLPHFFLIFFHLSTMSASVKSTFQAFAIQVFCFIAEIF